MKRIGILAALAAALASSGAYAADPFAKGSTKDDGDVFASPGVVNWTGFYVGVQGGYGNANHNLTLRAHDDGFEYPEEGDPVLVHGEDIDLLNFDGVNSHGAIGGGRIGFDWARGRLLFGAFAEYNFSNMETEVSGLALGGMKFGLEKDDEWSVGGRIGYIAAPRTLVYVLAAYTQTEYNVTGLDVIGASLPSEGSSFSTGATFDGITVGGGVELALTGNVFLGLEYQHTFYGEEDILKAHVDGEGGLSVGDDLDEDKIMATLKIKLNGGLLGN